MNKYDISVIIAVHRRIKTVETLINSINKNTVSNIQVVVCGDRSFLPSVDTVNHQSVTDYFISRGDFLIIKPDMPREPVDSKYVFVESENTRYLANDPSPVRHDLPNLNHMYYATSYAIPYCSSDFILGPAEDDLYFIKEWDTGFLEAVKLYDPQNHIYIHREYNSNHCLSDFKPSKYPLTCDERHALINTSPYMTDITTITTKDIEKWGEKHRGSEIKVHDILPSGKGWPLSEGGPFLIHRELLNRIGNYSGTTDYANKVLGVYGCPLAIPDALYSNNIKKIVQTTKVVMFHNLFKQNIIWSG